MSLGMHETGYGAYGNVMLDNVYVYGKSTSAYRTATMDIWNQGNGRTRGGSGSKNGDIGNAYMSVAGGFMSGLGKMQHTPKKLPNGLNASQKASLVAHNAIREVQIGKIASFGKKWSKRITIVGAACTLYTFLQSDKSGSDYAQLAGSAVVFFSGFVPGIGPLLSISLGVLDAYGAFDDLYDLYDFFD